MLEVAIVFAIVIGTVFGLRLIAGTEDTEETETERRWWQAIK
jgi:hypothetical protein